MGEESVEEEIKADVVVVGGGAAGLTAAAKTAAKGLKTVVASKGLGATALSTGAVDVLGYRGQLLLDSPLQGLKELVEEEPQHPYSLMAGKSFKGLTRLLVEALEAFRNMSRNLNLPYYGSLKTNLLLPTCFGTFKPTCLAPVTALHGDLKALDGGKMLLIGFKGYRELDVRYASEALALLAKARLNIDLTVEDFELAFPSLENRRNLHPIELASMLDRDRVFPQLLRQLKKVKTLGDFDVLGLPPALGFSNPAENLRRVEASLGVKAFELLPPPPSIPGQRLQLMLERAAQTAGAKVCLACEALRFEVKGGLARALKAKFRGRAVSFKAEAYVLATGGFLAGGLIVRGKKVFEPLLGFQAGGLWRAPLLEEAFFAFRGHPLFRLGLQVNQDLNPLNRRGAVIARNIYCAGGMLANTDYISEKSGLGVALTTGYMAGLKACGEA
jgi:glycerol-3-phosphate dehydrogenase subunit B